MRSIPALLSVVVLLSGCGAGGENASQEQAEEAANVQTYEGRGVVVAVTEDHVQIDHQEIPDFMDAMTMSFEVSDPKLLEGLEPGTEVTFRVVVGDRSAVIDRIEPVVE